MPSAKGVPIDATTTPKLLPSLPWWTLGVHAESWRHSLVVGEDLSVKLVLEVRRTKLGNVGMWDDILRPRGVAIWIMHGRGVVGVVLAVIEPHHLVVVHRVHIRKVLLILFVPSTAILPIVAH